MTDKKFEFHDDIAGYVIDFEKQVLEATYLDRTISSSFEKAHQTALDCHTKIIHDERSHQAENLYIAVYQRYRTLASRLAEQAHDRGVSAPAPPVPACR